MLEEQVAKVSRNCLHGNEMPAVLKALWKDQLENEESILIMVNEAMLVDSTEDDFFEGYRESDCEDKAMAKAYQKMFDQIAFFAKEADGGLVGYWLPGGATDLDAAPIVCLTNEGSFVILGTTFGDYVVYCCDTDMFFDEDDEVPMLDGLRAWLKDHGIDQTKSQDELDEVSSGYKPSPEETFDNYWDEFKKA